MIQELYYDNPDHFGQPFVSAYQITIEFATRYPADTETLSLPLGGAGTGQHSSLAQYLARELSQRIKSGEIGNIEGAWLHKAHVRSLVFTHNGKPMEASGGITASLSMFRIR